MTEIFILRGGEGDFLWWFKANPCKNGYLWMGQKGLKHDKLDANIWLRKYTSDGSLSRCSVLETKFQCEEQEDLNLIKTRAVSFGITSKAMSPGVAFFYVFGWRKHRNETCKLTRECKSIVKRNTQFKRLLAFRMPLTKRNFPRLWTVQEERKYWRRAAPNLSSSRHWKLRPDKKTGKNCLFMLDKHSSLASCCLVFYQLEKKKFVPVIISFDWP